ncbi:MAG: Holliday junction branch migration protein RuvA [bacterium]|nr:Holliday junction branch migration protein RuvA [bacterium]
MIAYIQGKVIRKTQKSAIIFTNGLGYEVFLPLKNLEKLSLEDQIELFIYSYIKEDAFDLYGFTKYEELDFFKKLISVSGVGPKSALNILALAEVNDLKRAITSGDSAMLQQVSGIGKKIAERLVVELKEKFIGDLANSTETTSSDRQVIDALMSLGYRQNEANLLIRDLPPKGDLASRIKEALKRVNSK